MTDEQREEFKTLDLAAQRTLLYQLGLFPACGHHRVKASLELAKENPEYKYLEKWSGVRVIAPPAGEVWVNSVRILGFYDNLPVQTEMSFADKMIYLRREYTDNFSDIDGGYRPPLADSKKGFRDTVAKILRTDTPSVLSPTVSLLTRPAAIWYLIKKVLTGNVDKKKELPFNHPTSANTIHAFSPLPNDLVLGLLKQIISRECTCSQANKKAKELRATALAREHILAIVKNFPKRMKDVSVWSHLIKKCPYLEQVADSALGYFGKKSKQTRQHLPALEKDVLANIKLQDDIRSKKIDPTNVDREEYPWLTAPVVEPRVFVASVGTMHFILLSCKTESANAWLQPREYGTSSFLLVCTCLETWLLH